MHSLSKTSLPLTATALLMLGGTENLVRLVVLSDGLTSLPRLRSMLGRSPSRAQVRSAEDERIIIAGGVEGLLGLDFRLLVEHNLLHGNRRCEARKIPQNPIRVHEFSCVTGLTNSQRNRSGKKYHILDKRVNPPLSLEIFTLLGYNTPI